LSAISWLRIARFAQQLAVVFVEVEQFEQVGANEPTGGNVEQGIGLAVGVGHAQIVREAQQRAGQALKDDVAAVAFVEEAPLAFLDGAKHLPQRLDGRVVFGNQATHAGPRERTDRRRFEQTLTRGVDAGFEAAQRGHLGDEPDQQVAQESGQQRADRPENARVVPVQAEVEVKQPRAGGDRDGNQMSRKRRQAEMPGG